jgi:hypothetical protein
LLSKITRVTRSRSIRIAALTALFLTMGLAASGRKFSLAPSNKAPGASGIADVKSDKHGNTEVDITVHNLAEPSKRDPPANTYVVWFQHQDSPPENAGELKVGEEMKGSLKTKTPWRNFEIYVTAETDPHVIEPPLGPMVMQAKIDLP